MGKNDYTPEEDYMMWELHEIRRKMAEEGIDLRKIRKRADKIAKEYGIKEASLKIQEPKKEYGNRH